MILTVNELLKKDLHGKIIVFPTDTVYGLGCLLGDLGSVERIFQIKQRDKGKPLAILSPSLDMAKPLVANPDDLLDLGGKYWPGALTLVVQKSSLVDDVTTAGNPTVGIRVPNHDLALQILSHFGPMVVTSLNLSSEPSILSFEDATLFEKLVDYMIDGGTLSAPASTVYDVTNQKVLRQGALFVNEDSKIRN